ncbi:carboxypeptidase regulatory-like domain-containing protein [Microbacterium sp. SSM24]|uniref:carboxypeptidase regulatory-like domain-containing protein n=1 Tax=Microbacterium sp. SSM24 TaxID=2991714 RepID=UPI0022262BF3|nr:carboxypeptidase regulatory-like domain-containing protein [Microbacterium sp. SSM24]MCW3492251.1 carboxypeptidase regulatory-like domain-containing protein [Microbacterium sp. SSM24]
MSPVWNRAPARLLAALTTGALVLGGALAVGPSAAADTTGGSIAGTVVDDHGQPLVDAWVSLSPVDGAGDSTGTWTDEAGAFEIAELRASDYTVRFESNQEGLVGEWWDDQPSATGASVVSVVEGETKQVHAALDAAGSISGTVTDETGAAVEGGDVQVYRFDVAAGSWNWQASATTAADGSYTVGSLPYGTFAVAFGSGEGVEIVPEYWVDAPSLEAATPLELERGEVVAGVDEQVQRAGRITGVVLDDIGQPVANASVSAHVEDVPGLEAWTSFGTTSGSDGTFAITSLPPGDYTVQFWPGQAPDLIGEWWDDAASRETASIVTVVAEAESSGIDAQLASGGVITGSVFDGAETAIADANVVLYDAEGGVVQTTSTLSNGIFGFGNLTPGTYTLSFSADTDSGRLTEWWNNASGRESATPVEVAAGTSTDGIDIVLDESDGSHLETFTASLSGVVTDGAGQPLGGVRVDVRASDGMSGDFAMTNAEGAWEMAGMAAGRYVVSFTGIVGGESITRFWEDAPDLESATVIDLARGEAHDGISAVLRSTPLPEVVGSTPKIAGTAKVGSTLTAQPGSWTDGADLAYQWKADGEVIPDATAETFTPTAAQLGAALTVVVLGTKSGHVAAERESTATAPVAAGALTTATPTISGSVAVGSVLTAVTGVWTDGTGFGYQWLAGGAVVRGATSPTLTLTTAQKDKQISVRVTGALAGYTSATKTSALTGKVATAASPKISGSAQVGSTLTAVPGTWTVSTTFRYQWYADGTALPGATKSTLLLTTAHDSRAITVRVTGAKSGYATVTNLSASTLKVTRFSTPSIGGALSVGSVLTAKPNTWSAGTTFTYQWYANGTAIPGATSPTFALGSAQRDKQMMVKVTGRQSGFTSVAVASASSVRVIAPATPTIVGTLMVGGTVTAKPNGWTPGAIFRYQWYADGLAISGATKATLVLGSAQRDRQISVKVTGSKPGYGSGFRTSASSLKVAVAPAPSVGGTVMVGSTLTARTGTWTPATTFTYQWSANGSAIAGATRSTFTPSRAYAGKRITVKVVGSNSGYQRISRDSAATAAVRSGKAAPATRDNCPSGYPIKGNQTTRHTTDWIYHVPGGRYYAITDPEECFASEAAAVAWGYRKSLQ